MKNTLIKTFILMIVLTMNTGIFACEHDHGGGSACPSGSAAGGDSIRPTAVMRAAGPGSSSSHGATPSRPLTFWDGPRWGQESWSGYTFNLAFVVIVSKIASDYYAKFDKWFWKKKDHCHSNRPSVLSALALDLEAQGQQIRRLKTQLKKNTRSPQQNPELQALLQEAENEYDYLAELQAELVHRKKNGGSCNGQCGHAH